ncbi:Holliday junction resolvase RuvX [Patescibacteria group bacterium]|nr:Holliday junction resolvase RuvX [Patescibacteria group bacterium]
MRILSIDYGTINTGLALGENGVTMPFDSIRTKSSKELVTKIKQVIFDEKIEVLVVGIPNNPDSLQRNITLNFVEELKKEIKNTKIELQDETGTSKDAMDENFESFKKLKKVKKKLHTLSAENILKRYFEGIYF